MTPRVSPIPPGEWSEEMQAALAALRPTNPRLPFPERDSNRPKGLNLLGTLAHHTDLTRAFHTLAGHALFGTTLSERQRELLVLRVAAVRECEYEWAQHLVLAAAAGITQDEIAAVRGGTGLDGAEQALLDAVDELLRDAEVSAATWSALATELHTQQLMDVVFTVGTYDTLAMAMKSFGVELDADLRKPSSH